MGDAFWDSMRCDKCYRKTVDLCPVCDKELIEQRNKEDALKRKLKRKLKLKKKQKEKSK